MENTNLLLGKFDLIIGLIAGLIPSYFVYLSNKQKLKIEKELKYFESYFVKKCNAYSKFYEEYSKSFASPDSISNYETFYCALNQAMLFAPIELMTDFENMDKSIALRKSAYDQMVAKKIPYEKFLSACTDCAEKRRAIMHALNSDIASCRKSFQEEK